VTLASLSYNFTFSSSSIALLSLASFEETSWFCFLFSRSTRSISLFCSLSCDSNPCTFYCSSKFYDFSLPIYVFYESILFWYFLDSSVTFWSLPSTSSSLISCKFTFFKVSSSSDCRAWILAF
jgi:hypothetical protein